MDDQHLISHYCHHYHEHGNSKPKYFFSLQTLLNEVWIILADATVEFWKNYKNYLFEFFRKSVMRKKK